MSPSIKVRGLLNNIKVAPKWCPELNIIKFQRVILRSIAKKAVDSPDVKNKIGNSGLHQNGMGRSTPRRIPV